MLKNKNFAYSTLAGGISDSAVSLTVTTSEGARFPSTGEFMCVLWDGSAAAPGNDPYREIVEMSLTSGDTFEVARSQEGTTAKAWSAGDNIALVITAGKMDEIEKVLQNGETQYGVATGTDTYALTLSPAISAYSDGLCVRAKFNNANTGAATLNVNAKGAKKIYYRTKTGYSQIASGAIVDDMFVELFYLTTLDGGAGGWVIDHFFGVAAVGDETVSGVKTFVSFPVGPSSLPTTDYQLANKKYVDAVIIPSGTIMLFNQASAPTGWTKKEDWANVAALHVGNNYAEGGKDSPRSYTTEIGIANHDNHAHSGPNHRHTGPLHNHTVVVPRDGWGSVGPYTLDGYICTVGGTSGSQYAASNRTLISSNAGNTVTGYSGTGNTGSAGAASHNIGQSTYTPRFVQVIAAIKD